MGLIADRNLNCFPGIITPIDTDFQSGPGDAREVAINPDGLASAAMTIPFIFEGIIVIELGRKTSITGRSIADPLIQDMILERKEPDAIPSAVVLHFLLRTILAKDHRRRIIVLVDFKRSGGVARPRRVATGSGNHEEFANRVAGIFPEGLRKVTAIIVPFVHMNCARTGKDPAVASEIF